MLVPGTPRGTLCPTPPFFSGTLSGTLPGTLWPKGPERPLYLVGGIAMLNPWKLFCFCFCNPDSTICHENITQLIHFACFQKTVVDFSTPNLRIWHWKLRGLLVTFQRCPFSREHSTRNLKNFGENLDQDLVHKFGMEMLEIWGASFSSFLT